MLTHPIRSTLALSTLALGIACAVASDDESPELRSSCWGAACCPTGTIAVTGTSADDTLVATSSSQCLLGLEGDDEIHSAAGGAALGGPGEDVAYGSPGSESFFGHDGNDELRPYGGNDEIWPGPGMDTVIAGYGNDLIVINALCEVAAGETLGGGPGTDTIRSPFTEEQLIAAGAQLGSIEVLERVPRDIGKAECCDADACGDHGACEEDQGMVSCACEPGYTGRTCAFETAKVLPEFLGLADPTSWSFDPLGNRHYRRTTELELEANGWQPGTFLVTLGGLDVAFEQADASTMVTLPMTDSTTMQLQLDLRATDDTRKFVSMDGSRVDPTSGGPVIEGLRPTFNIYGSKVTELVTGIELHGIVATAVTVQELGQFDIQGVADRQGASGQSTDAVVVSNPDPDWYIESIPGPSVGPGDLYLVSWTVEETVAQWPPGLPSDVCALGIAVPPNTQGWHPCDLLEPDPPADCGDGIDNDGDGDIDGKQSPNDTSFDEMCEHTEACDPATSGKSYPPHTHVTEVGKHFGLFGDINWCTKHEADWVAKIYELGLDAQQSFTTPPGESGGSGTSPGYDDLLDRHQVPVRFSVAKCWILGDVLDANACQLQGGTSCHPFDAASTSVHVYPYEGLGAELDDDDVGSEATRLAYFAAVREDLAHAARLPAPHNLDYPLDFAQVVLRPANANSWDAEGFTYTCRRESIIKDDTGTGESKQEIAERTVHEIGHDFSCVHREAKILDPNKQWSVMHTDEPEDDATYDAFADEEDDPSNQPVSNYDSGRFAKPCADRIVARVNQHGFLGSNTCENPNPLAWGPTFGY